MVKENTTTQSGDSEKAYQVRTYIGFGVWVQMI